MITLRSVVAGAVIALGSAASLAEAAAGNLDVAIVVRDQIPLRAAPRDSAQSNAVLWQGEALEVRGERMDYLQVYDYRRERGGFVRASQVRRTALAAANAPELLAIVHFLRDTPGAEALGIGFAAAYVRAAPPEALNSDSGIEALDALGTFADRLARRISSAPTSKAAQTVLSAHVDVATRYGVNFTSREREGRVQLCYDGYAFRRVLAMRSSPEQRARAALALTRSECLDSALRPVERNRMDEWRAEVLDRADTSALPPYLKNRILMRRASVWSTLAYQRMRTGGDATAAANRALTELGAINKAELTDEDKQNYNDAAVRVSASRWASYSAPAIKTDQRLHVVTVPGESGETCIELVDAKHAASGPLAKRCTYGIVWTASATVNREATAVAVAVQPTEAWREMWVFHRAGDGWKIRVVPPAVTTPDVGYAEFAGWVPGGAKMLVAREATGDGKSLRRFEVVRLDTFATERQASDPSVLRAFQAWQDPSWNRETLSMR